MVCGRRDRHFLLLLTDYIVIGMLPGITQNRGTCSGKFFTEDIVISSSSAIYFFLKSFDCDIFYGAKNNSTLVDIQSLNINIKF